MATRKTQTTAKAVRVYCSNCQLYKRDTEGISFRISTGEYFMGDCPKGVTDGRITYDENNNPIGHVFSDKARVCKHHKPKRNE